MTIFSTCELSAPLPIARMPSPSRGLITELRMSHSPKHLSIATMNSPVRTDTGPGICEPPCETRTPCSSVLEPRWLRKSRPDLLRLIVLNAKSHL